MNLQKGLYVVSLNYRLFLKQIAFLKFKQFRKKRDSTNLQMLFIVFKPYFIRGGCNALHMNVVLS